MRLWISKSSEVRLHEQLVSQFILGIISHDLPPGSKLPSTRELARRFRIHPNTVSAAYRELAERGWVEFRAGSGVYVRHFAADDLPESKFELDELIATFLRVARGRGFSLAEIKGRVAHWLELQPPDHLMVIEPDAELRPILVTEIKSAVSFPVHEATLEACADEQQLAGAAPVAMYNQAETVRAALPPNTSCLLLRSRSVPESLAGERLPAADELIAVASRWPEFLRWARTILVAAGVDAGALDFRDARQPNWQRGLNRSSHFVITDLATAAELPADCRTRIFRIIADKSIAELQSFVEQFLHHATTIKGE